MIVRQAFAHVWAEVWMDKKGWVRVDPTAAVNENRVDTESLELASRSRSETQAADSVQGFFPGLWIKATLAWDAVNYIWYAKIMGYSSDDQKRFLAKIGLSLNTLGGIFKVFGVSVILAGVFVLAYYLWRSPASLKKKDPVRTAYQMFLKKMARAGVPHEGHEGPQTFASKCVALRQDLAHEIQDIIHLYILIRYGGQDDDDMIRTFKQHVRRFHAGQRIETILPPKEEPLGTKSFPL